MKQLILLTVTAFMLFSCSKENDDRSQEKTKNVVVQFAPASLTRATEGAVTGAATISNYTIFFLDAAGNVVKGTVTNNSKPTGAVPCTDVGETAISVYVVANASSVIDLTALTPANNSKLADIKAKVAAVSTQTTIASVVLANSGKANNGKIITTTTSGTTSYAAAVEIAPVICRLEIGKICGTGDITGFKLEGIYIDGHAEKFNVGGEYDKTATGSNITAGIYSIGVDNGKLSGYPTTFCDVAQITAVKDGANPKYIAAPADSKVWAYQLAAGAPMPKIIVKLSDVNGGSETKYVTVNTYKNAGTSYTQLAAGTVYKIDEISFAMQNTAEVPNATEKNVSVTVTVKAWEVVNLTPEV